MDNIEFLIDAFHALVEKREDRIDFCEDKIQILYRIIYELDMQIKASTLLCNMESKHKKEREAKESILQYLS